MTQPPMTARPTPVTPDAVAEAMAKALKVYGSEWELDFSTGRTTAHWIKDGHADWKAKESLVRDGGALARAALAVWNTRASRDRAAEQPRPDAQSAAAPQYILTDEDRRRLDEVAILLRVPRDQLSSEIITNVIETARLDAAHAEQAERPRPDAQPGATHPWSPADLVELPDEVDDPNFWIDERGLMWLSPTAWAYAQVCKARDSHQARADAAEAALATARRDAEAGAFETMVQVFGRMDAYAPSYVPVEIVRRIRIVQKEAAQQRAGSAGREKGEGAQDG